MTIPPLAIIQARMGSRRLPGKVLLPVGGVPLVERVWRACCAAFGLAHVVVAHPDTPENEPLADFLERLGALRYAHAGDEDDVLSRFHACAHRYRWHPSSVIVRVCADNPFLDPLLLRRSASGERFSGRVGGEAFTLGALDAAHVAAVDPFTREHIRFALGLGDTPPAPLDALTVDTEADLERANDLATLHGGWPGERVLVVDVDGTLCEDGTGIPRPNVLAYIQARKADGWRVVVDTARRWELEARTREQLASWGVEYDELRCGVKIPAAVYLDDRTIRPREISPDGKERRSGIALPLVLNAGIAS